MGLKLWQVSPAAAQGLLIPLSELGLLRQPPRGSLVSPRGPGQGSLQSPWRWGTAESCADPARAETLCMQQALARAPSEYCTGQLLWVQGPLSLRHLLLSVASHQPTVPRLAWSPELVT